MPYMLVKTPHQMSSALSDGFNLIVTAGTTSKIHSDGAQTRTDVRVWMPDFLQTLSDELSVAIAHVEVQVDQISHGRSYDYTLDGPIEKSARELANMRVYVITSDSLSAVTCLEIMNDVALGRKNIIIYFVGMVEGAKPQFNPIGFEDGSIFAGVNGLQRKTLEIYKVAGKSLRNNLIDMLMAMCENFGHLFTLCYSEEDVKRVIRRKFEAE